MLQKSLIPAPSAALDKNILQQFRLEREQSRRSQKTSWWHNFLVGSITVPKPIVAAAVVIAVAFGLFNLIERSTSKFSDVADVKTPVPNIF